MLSQNPADLVASSAIAPPASSINDANAKVASCITRERMIPVSPVSMGGARQQKRRCGHASPAKFVVIRTILLISLTGDLCGRYCLTFLLPRKNRTQGATKRRRL
jgi:hypothetical protein